MSRSGYSDDVDNWQLVRWRGAVKSAIRGNRGQQLLREMLEALDAMPVKELIAGELEKDGQYCALGVIGKRKGKDMTTIDPYDATGVATTFNIAPALACEIVYENDDGGWNETPSQRWERMREWVSSHIHKGEDNESNS